MLPNPSEGNPPEFLNGEGDAAKAAGRAAGPGALRDRPRVQVTQDPYVGKMGIFRIHQGTVTRDSQLYIGDGRVPSGSATCSCCRARSMSRCPAVPGDICAVAKVDDIHFDAVLHRRRRGRPSHLKALTFPTRCNGPRIDPKARAATSSAWDPVQKLVDEDPCLKVEHVVVTNETVVYGLGELHLRTLRAPDRGLQSARSARARRASPTARPSPAGRRPPPAQEAERRRGPVRRGVPAVEPLRGGGFGSSTRSGRHDPGPVHPRRREKRRAPRSPCRRHRRLPGEGRGVIVYDGKHHSVDSGDRLRHRRPQAFIDADEEGRPIVLEPIANVEITAPEAAIGDITGDLSSKRGPVSGTRSAQARTLTVLGQAPAVRAQRLPVPAPDDQRPGPLHAHTSATTRRFRRTCSNSSASIRRRH